MADERTDPQYKLRMPADLKERIEEAARANKRSMNAEIVARLEASLDRPTDQAKDLEFDAKVREAADYAATIAISAFVRALPRHSPSELSTKLSETFPEAFNTLSAVVASTDPYKTLAEARNRIVHMGDSDPFGPSLQSDAKDNRPEQRRIQERIRDINLD